MSTNLKNTDILCEFLEIVVHNILYHRKLYPRTIFAPKRKYGVVVYQSVHPGVNEYISESLKAVAFHARKNQLKKVLMCFHSPDAEKEKFVFDVLNIRTVLDSDPFLVDLEQAFRTFFLKLHNTDFYLEDLPEDATFSIKLVTTAYSSIEFNQDASHENFPWIDCTEIQQSLETVNIVPVHMIDKDCLTLQVYIEKP